ncbi:hypothetical protein GGE67_004097 [Rhizobium leucaenae]|nr:hypothetical protein [Rhizobium leucaenae]
MINLRSVQPDDIDQLYVISLVTGDAGKNATALHRDGRMIGHIYSVPYAVLSPKTVFVAEDGEGVCGYIAGVFDTVTFEERLEREWWPELRKRYAEPSGDASAWDADQQRSFTIHHPKRAPVALTDPFPAHIHMNLLPRTQGQGIGMRFSSDGSRMLAPTASKACIWEQMWATTRGYASGHRADFPGWSCRSG